MYSPQFYKNFSKKQIAETIIEEGFDPFEIFDEPGFVYSEHKHPETKILAFIEGSMDIKFGGRTYHCTPGDKVIIPGNTLHAAKVGKDGCRFFWSEKLILQ